ncbi:uncharacterized protein LOC129761707 [Toxorhynchites rutilus septentrionalis]|uniref:uncharacterized protein LOC129761707 n=1 Tax=Toxorhynchites rutilus septentrionalis TaxID=329112 RepID=UPI0024789664|nr:uncharacterized protein LOC129761707 [Toxorhynchites rutilus septentrionalis]
MFGIIVLAFCVSAIHSSIHVHDLTNNPLAIIPLGKARIKTGYVRIVHPIDLIQIGNTISNVNDEIQSNPSVNPLYELMQIKNYKLYETFLKLKPFIKRQKRWDTIGTVWKWVAGNPDADDLRIINATLNSLITQNNKQVMINQAISNRIQEVTDLANQMLLMEKQKAKNHSIEINHLMILSNLDSLQDQIETLEEAILMAKHGIPSSKLLSMRDFNTIATFLGDHDIFVTSFEELLSQSTAQVTLNNTHIAYILKVPQFSKDIYEYGLVKRIDDASILINNALVQVSSNCSNSNQQLNGSFLIQFEGCTLRINGEFFSNFETILPGRPYHPTTGLIVTELDTLDSPPVEYLQNLTLEHRDELEILKLQSNSLTWKLHLFGSIGGFTVVSIIATIGVFLYLSRKTIINAKFSIPSINKDDIILTETVSVSKNEIITNSKTQSSKLSAERENEIQSFIDMPSPFRTIKL